MHTRFKHILTGFLVCCLVLSLGAAVRTEAKADDEVISKVLTTLSSTPVALVDPSLITVATSTPGCHINSAGWFNANNQAVTGAFNTETYRLEINIGADNGYIIDPNVACYLNNSAITSVVSADRKSVTLTREYTADVWAPTVYKNPGDETVDEGGWASFVVSGSYARDYEWALVDPTDKITIPISQLKDHYKNMDSAGDGSTKLFLYHIPYELNKWKVVCNFIGAGDGNVTRSQPAVITVRPDPSRVVESPSPSPSASPVSPTPSPEVSAVPEPTATAEEHVHDYSGAWRYDARGHWHECPEDGAVADEGLHVFTWTETRAATDTEQGLEDGVCGICGFTTTRKTGTPAGAEEKEDAVEKEPAGLPSPLISALCALLPVDMILIGAHAAGSSRKKTRRRK